MDVYTRGGKWYVHLPKSFAGRRLRVSLTKHYGATTRGEAMKAAHTIAAQIRAGKYGETPAKSLSEGILKWLEEHAVELKYESRVKSHARALLPFVKGKTFDDVPEVVQAVKNMKRQRGDKDARPSPATINRRLAVLRRVCKLAYGEWKWLKAPVHTQVSLLSEKGSERHVYLSVDAVEELAAACQDKEAGDLVRVAAWTGLRRSELMRLNEDPTRFVREWQEVGEDHMEILLGSETKTGRPRVVPIHNPEVMEIIRRMPLPVTDSLLRVNWDAARLTCKAGHVRFHDLRHSFASWLATSGAQATDIRDLLGHTDLRTTSRYTHLMGKRLRDVVENIGGGE